MVSPRQRLENGRIPMRSYASNVSFQRWIWPSLYSGYLMVDACAREPRCLKHARSLRQTLRYIVIRVVRWSISREALHLNARKNCPMITQKSKQLPVWDRSGTTRRLTELHRRTLSVPMSFAGGLALRSMFAEFVFRLLV